MTTRRITFAAAAVTLLSGATLLTSRPARATETNANCDLRKIVEIVNTLCENGGRVTNIHTGDGTCSFSVTCL